MKAKARKVNRNRPPKMVVARATRLVAGRSVTLVEYRVERRAEASTEALRRLVGFPFLAISPDAAAQLVGTLTSVGPSLGPSLGKE